MRGERSWSKEKEERNHIPQYVLCAKLKQTNEKKKKIVLRSFCQFALLHGVRSTKQIFIVSS